MHLNDTCPLAVISLTLQIVFTYPIHGEDDFQTFSHVAQSRNTSLSVSKDHLSTRLRAGSVYDGYAPLCTLRHHSGDSYRVLEKNTDACGEFVYVNQSGTAYTIHKVFGTVGKQVPPPVASHTHEHWQTVLHSPSDILAREYLADPRDPSYERTKGRLAPQQYPDSFLGMREHPHEIPICWDGSIGLDPGFFTGFEGSVAEYPAALSFALNGKSIHPDETLQVLRGQLEHYLPIAQYVYQRAALQMGFEELILVGKADGKAGLFVRFRLVNYSNKGQTLSLTAQPPVDGTISRNDDDFVIDAPYPVPSFFVNGKISPSRIPVDYKMAGKKLLQQKEKVFSVNVLSDPPPTFENGRLVWDFKLPSGGSRDLYILLPGYCAGEPLRLRQDEVKGAFYSALFDEFRDWQEFLGRGVQFSIPEPMVAEIYKGALVKGMVITDGDEIRGGAVHYENFRSFHATYLPRIVLELGYSEEARRYLEHILKHRIEPSGRFRFDEQEDARKIYELGLLLTCLSEYYSYTRDASLIMNNPDPIGRVLDHVYQARAASMTQYPSDDPRYGLVTEILNHDIREGGCYYLADAFLVIGLRDYANTLVDIGKTHSDRTLAKQGEAMAEYAGEYHALLRRSFRTAQEWEDGALSFLHIHPVLPGTPSPYMCRFRTKQPYRYNRAWNEWPKLVGSGFLTDEEVRFIFDYEAKHEYTVLGLRRATVLNDFSFRTSGYQRLRLGMVREFLMKYYAYMNYLLSPGFWSGYEQLQLIPEAGSKGRLGRLDPTVRNGLSRTALLAYFRDVRISGNLFARYSGFDGSHGTWPIPRLTRQIFCFDEPGGGAVWLARGVPRHWLRDGQEVSAVGMPTRYGKVDLKLRYDKEEREVLVSVTPLERRTIPELRIGVRDPEGGTPVAAECVEPKGKSCTLKAKHALVIVSDVDSPITLRVKYTK